MRVLVGINLFQINMRGISNFMFRQINILTHFGKLQGKRISHFVLSFAAIAGFEVRVRQTAAGPGGHAGHTARSSCQLADDCP